MRKKKVLLILLMAVMTFFIGTSVYAETAPSYIKVTSAPTVFSSGQILQFYVTGYDVNNATVPLTAAGITWEISGNSSLSTNINNNGKLVIGTNENASSIVVTVRYYYPTAGYYDQTTIQNTSAASSTSTSSSSTPTLRSISITNVPSSFSVGTSFQLGIEAFDTTNHSMNLSTSDVRWTLTGNNSSGTSVSSSGRVTIDPYETSSEIQISAQDSLGTWSSVIRSTITLRNSRPYQNLKSVEITNKPTEFTPGKSFQLYFNAYDDAGRPIDISTLNVRWSLTGNNSTGTTIDNSGRVTIDPYESSSELRITLEVLGVAPIYGIGDTFILKSTNPYRVTVIRISPLNSATNVPIKGQIVVEFSGPVSRSLGTLTLNGVKTNLSAPVYSSSDKVLTYDYDGLLNLTNYTIELSSFRDYANNNPIETFSSKFTTIGHPTTVAVVSPAAGKTDVPASGNIVVTFNNEISKLGTIRLYGNKITHVIEISLSELTLTADKKSVVTLYQNLDKGEYMIEISGFVDGSGNVVPTFQSKFQTSDEGAASLAEVSQASESSAANEITLNPVSVNGTVATLSWNVPALTASNFTIERSDAAANPTFKQIAKVNASTSKTAYTYSDRTVKNGISYLYRIKAFDQNGKQVLKTAQVGVWVSTQKAKFTLEALDGNAVRIKLTSPVSGAEGYDILRSTSANGTYTKIASIKSGSTFTDTNENSDKRIYYRVIPYKSVQNVKYYSAPSDKVSIATSAVKTPVVKLSSKKTGQVTVSWQPSENAGSYRIYRSTSPDSGFKNIKTVKDTTQSSYVSTGLVSGTTYYFKIVAYDKDNNRASTSTVKSIAAK